MDDVGVEKFTFWVIDVQVAVLGGTGLLVVVGGGVAGSGSGRKEGVQVELDQALFTPM